MGSHYFSFLFPRSSVLYIDLYVPACGKLFSTVEFSVLRSQRDLRRMPSVAIHVVQVDEELDSPADTVVVPPGSNVVGHVSLCNCRQLGQLIPMKGGVLSQVALQYLGDSSVGREQVVDSVRQRQPHGDDGSARHD